MSGRVDVNQDIFIRELVISIENLDTEIADIQEDKRKNEEKLKKAKEDNDAKSK